MEAVSERNRTYVALSETDLAVLQKLPEHSCAIPNNCVGQALDLAQESLASLQRLRVAGLAEIATLYIRDEGETNQTLSVYRKAEPNSDIVLFTEYDFAVLQCLVDSVNPLSITEINCQFRQKGLPLAASTSIRRLMAERLVRCSGESTEVIRRLPRTVNLYIANAEVATDGKTWATGSIT